MLAKFANIQILERGHKLDIPGSPISMLQYLYLAAWRYDQEKSSFFMVVVDRMTITLRVELIFIDVHVHLPRWSSG